MVRHRIVETHEGIQDEFDVKIYDQMQRRMRDKGWMVTGNLISAGIDAGTALEIGPGPGYLGLEWLKRTEGTLLKGVEISREMIAFAERNALEYDLQDRVEYVSGSGDSLPFEDESLDAVFTNGSLHEWDQPEQTFNEIWRVLKKNGRMFISDLRRDMHFLIRYFIWINTRPREIRPGFLSSVNAAYTKPELEEMIKDTRLKDCNITANPIGLQIIGQKTGGRK